MTRGHKSWNIRENAYIRRGEHDITGTSPGTLEKLPADAQDAIATRLLAEVADEHAWAERFEATTDAQWDGIAASVRQAIATEDLVPLDDVLPLRIHP